MNGFLATLTPTQRSLALAYRGEEEDLFEVPALDDTDVMDAQLVREDFYCGTCLYDNPLHDYANDEDLIDVTIVDRLLSLEEYEGEFDE